MHGLLLAALCLFLLPSCSGDEEPAPDTPQDKSGLCKVTLRLNVSSFSQDGTTGTRSVQGSTDEDRIRDIWIFQYNAETGEFMKEQPVYLDDFDSSDIEVDLEPNNNPGEQSLVCIVANIHEESWAFGTDKKINEELNTYKKLVNNVLPRNALDPFTSSHMGEGANDKTIPMFGVSKAITITSNCYVNVPLERMFARVDVKIDASYLNDFGLTLTGGGFTFSNIPYYSQIGTIAPDDESEAATYPANVNWQSFDGGGEVKNIDNYILYVPENVQGKVEGMESKQDEATADLIPEHALKVVLTLCDKEDATKQHLYTIYPGLDMVNDFNVKRNHIYKVNVSITKKPE